VPKPCGLAAASDEDVDLEMLSTFIEEAQDVLGSIATQVARLHVSPYDNGSIHLGPAQPFIPSKAAAAWSV
jgi:hypothetical protein